jgi:hypothetical protein
MEGELLRRADIFAHLPQQPIRFLGYHGWHSCSGRRDGRCRRRRGDGGGLRGLSACNPNPGWRRNHDGRCNQRDRSHRGSPFGRLLWCLYDLARESFQSGLPFAFGLACPHSCIGGYPPESIRGGEGIIRIIGISLVVVTILLVDRRNFSRARRHRRWRDLCDVRVGPGGKHSGRLGCWAARRDAGPPGDQPCRDDHHRHSRNES